MKRRIRLTESDLHRVIKESIRRILNEGLREPRSSHGRVSNQGNGMVGGAYGHDERFAFCDISGRFYEILDDTLGYDVANKVCDWINEQDISLEVEGIVSASFDDSVGTHYVDYNIEEMDEEKIEKEKQILGQYPDKEIAQSMVKAYDLAIEDITVEDFEIEEYEPYEPDCDDDGTGW